MHCPSNHEICKGLKICVVNLATEKSDLWNSRIAYADDRQNISSDSLVTLQIQAASILFTFTSFFSKDLVSQLPFYLKIIYSLSLVALITSIVFGIIGFYTKLRFWKAHRLMMGRLTEKWYLVRKGELTLDVMESYKDGSAGGLSQLNASPWARVVQSVFFFLGLTLMLIIYFGVIFEAELSLLLFW